MSRDLQKAIIDGDTPQAVTLLYDSTEVRDNINRPYYQSKYNLKVTTLYLACDHGLEHLVEILLDIPGIAVNYEAERGGDTPLHAAASGGYQGIVKLLIKVKSHCIANRFGSTPIHRAVVNGHPDTLALLLDYDKKFINAETLNKTPLHWACKHGDLRCVEILVEHGADRTLRNSNNKLPADMAKEKGYTTVVRYLKGQDAEQGEATSELKEDDDTMATDDDTMVIDAYDVHDGQLNLRSFADFGAHQAHVEEEQLKVNNEYAERINALEGEIEGQKSYNEMFVEDIEDVKQDCLDLRSLAYEQEQEIRELVEVQQQQGTFNTEVKGRIESLQVGHNTQRENTEHEMKALCQRVESLEQKLGKSKEPPMNSNHENARRLCDIVRDHLPYLKENMVANEHIDYLFSKRALTLEDIQAIQDKPYGLAQTGEMLYRLLGKADPTWIHFFLKSLDRVPATKCLLQKFR